jgi:hypothetical protein
MSACPVADSLLAYERECDREAQREAFIEERAAAEAHALARRLIRHPPWVIQAMDENRDIAISVAQAAGYAADGDYLLGGSRLVRALEPQAKEDALRIMAEELGDYIDKLPPKRLRDPDASGPPDADDIDLSKHYPDYAA